MLTERLKAAIESATQLPPDAQEKVAAQLENAIANALWDADLNDPENDEWLAEWIEEARQDETVDFPLPSSSTNGVTKDSKGTRSTEGKSWSGASWRSPRRRRAARCHRARRMTHSRWGRRLRDR